MNKILIDTNIYSYAMRGDEKVISSLQQVTHIGISSISIGELLSGFKAGNKEGINRKELNVFLDSPRVNIYYIDEFTAEFYSAILNQLKTARDTDSDQRYMDCCYSLTARPIRLHA